MVLCGRKADSCKKKSAFSKISVFVWTGQKHKQNNRRVLYYMYCSYNLYPAWLCILKRNGACHSVQFDFLFKFCLSWCWLKMTTFNSLIASTSVSDHFKITRVLFLSQVLYQTLPLNLLYFKSVAIRMHDIWYHKQLSTTKYFTLIQHYWSSTWVQH